MYACGGPGGVDVTQLNTAILCVRRVVDGKGDWEQSVSREGREEVLFIVCCLCIRKQQTNAITNTKIFAAILNGKSAEEENTT